MQPTAVILATGTPSERLFSDIMPWLVGLTVVVLVGAVVVYAIRRSLTTPRRGIEEGFTLHDLRDLHASGDLSDEEFERARDRMIGRLKSEISDEPSADNDEQPTS